MGGWVSTIIFIITNVPKVISLIKQILDMFGDKKAAKEALPTLLDVEIKKADVGPLRQIIRARRMAKL